MHLTPELNHFLSGFLPQLADPLEKGPFGILYHLEMRVKNPDKDGVLPKGYNLCMEALRNLVRGEIEQHFPKLLEEENSQEAWEMEMVAMCQARAAYIQDCLNLGAGGDLVAEQQSKQMAVRAAVGQLGETFPAFVNRKTPRVFVLQFWLHGGLEKEMARLTEEAEQVEPEDHGGD